MEKRVSEFVEIMKEDLYVHVFVGGKKLRTYNVSDLKENVYSSYNDILNLPVKDWYTTQKGLCVKI